MTLLLCCGRLLHLHVLKVLLLLRVSLLLLMVLPKLTLLLHRQVARRLRSRCPLSRRTSSSTSSTFLGSLLTTQLLLLAFVIANISRRGRSLLLALLCLLYRHRAAKQAVLRQYLDL